MKKILAFLTPLVLLTALAGCSEIGENAPLLPQDGNTVSAARSIEEADEIALRAFEAFHPDGQGHESRAALSLAHTVITSHASRSNNPDTIFHIVDYGDDLGFAVMGGPKHSEPLYAFVENGSFNDPEVAKVEGFQYFLECAGIMIRDSMNIEVTDSMKVGGGGTAEIKTKTEYHWNLVKNGGRIINLAWRQGQLNRGGEFEGIYCPNKVGGCVMTAALIVMAYHQQPTSMEFTFPERDCQRAVFNWQSMKTHFAYHGRKFRRYDENGVEITITNDCSASEQDHRNLGRIVRQIGYEAEATYKSGATGASTARVAGLMESKYLTNMEYIPLYWNKWSNEDELTQLIDQGVAMTKGSDVNGGGGHAWVTDAYKTMDYYEDLYRLRVGSGSNGEEWDFVESKKIKTSNFIHYNWGWDGYCNGYFFIGAFNTKEPFTYDPGITSGGNYHDFAKDTSYFFFLPK